MRAAHGAEMRRLGSILRQCFIMEFPRSHGIKTKIELVFPAKFEAGLRYRVVAVLRTRVSLRAVVRMGRNLLGDHAVLNVFFFRQFDMLFRLDVAEHPPTVPSKSCSAHDPLDVVCTWCNVPR